MAVIENDVIKVTVSNSGTKNVIRVSPGVAALASVSISLNDLNNVDTSGITNGQTIVYDNGSFVAGDSGAVETINGVAPDGNGDVVIDFSVDGLSDVDAATPSTGDILKYETNRWVNDSLGKADVDLANVDNTSDADKPISTATQTALNAKANTSSVPTSLNDLSDVVISGAPSKNQALVYDSTAGAFKSQVSYTNRFEDEVETGLQMPTIYAERGYSVKSEGDGIFIDPSPDTPAAGKVIQRKIYHKTGFITDDDVIGDYTLIHTFADDTAYADTVAVFDAFEEGATYGVPPFTLFQTWEEVTAAPAFTGLLNETYGSGAEAAYSTRRLNGNVTDCMVIRRASDSTTTTIGFDGSGNISEADIETFCTGTTCTVSEWKDQSGNGNDATQTDSTKQPTIYTSGALVKENGKVALHFTGDALDQSEFLNSGDALTFVFVSSNLLGQTATPKYFLYTDQGNVSGSIILRTQSGSTSTSVNAGYSLTNYVDGTAAQWTDRGTAYNLFVSGQRLSFNYGSVNTTQVGPMLIGNRTDSSTQNINGKLQEMLFWPADQSSVRTDIEENIGDYFTQNTPLLDTYSGAAAAYSLRLLDSTYTGAAIEVYAGTNGTADIGFNIFGELDTVALAAHCGTQIGTVQTWYDQSGNGNNAINGNTGGQPQIWDGSGVVTQNGKPAVDFTNNVNLFLKNSSGQNLSISATDYSFIFVQKRATASGWIFDSQSGRFVISSGSPSGLFFDGAWKGSEQTTTAHEINYLDFVSPSSTNYYVNGSLNQGSLSYTQKAIGGLTSIGREYSGSVPINGTLQEFVIYTTPQTDNRTGIETNINTFYDIY